MLIQTLLLMQDRYQMSQFLLSMHLGQLLFKVGHVCPFADRGAIEMTMPWWQAESIGAISANNVVVHRNHRAVLCSLQNTNTVRESEPRRTLTLQRKKEFHMELGKGLGRSWFSTWARNWTHKKSPARWKRSSLTFFLIDEKMILS